MFGYVTRKKRKPAGIGRTRIKLAKMLQEHWPDYNIDPARLIVQNPVFASARWDCCKWVGSFYPKNGGQITIDIYSWDSMGEIVKKGFDVDKDDLRDFEISAK